MLQEGLTTPLFLCRLALSGFKRMDQEKLKLIIRNLELLVEALKSEVYSDANRYIENVQSNLISDYDEVFDDDDGYPD